MSPGLAAYTSVTFLFALTPGATTAVVVRSAIEGGWRAGVRTAIGAAGANLCQALAAGFGLAVIVRRAAMLWAGVQAAGVVYLGWLGVQSLWRLWLGVPRAALSGSSQASAGGTALRQGLLANIFNPSIGTFYLVIVPSFLPANASARVFALYSAIHISMAFCCHSAWAGAFDRLRELFKRPVFARGVEGTTGAALLWLAWRMAVKI
jgi:threonine/homoserine/homoserine lactone efflux protein